MPAIANAATAKRYIDAAKNAKDDTLQQALGKLPGHERLKQAVEDQKVVPAPAKAPVMAQRKGT